MKICTGCVFHDAKSMSGAQWCYCCALGHGNGEDMAVIAYDPTIHGEDDVRRNRLREWLEANGLDTRFISVNGTIRVEGSHIHFLGYVLDKDGVKVHGDKGPLMAGMSARLKVEWTEPDNG